MDSGSSDHTTRDGGQISDCVWEEVLWPADHDLRSLVDEVLGSALVQKTEDSHGFLICVQTPLIGLCLERQTTTESDKPRRGPKKSTLQALI
jgi:hypothetical protein